jgi:intracellular multiplication protein IcmJ
LQQQRITPVLGIASTGSAQTAVSGTINLGGISADLRHKIHENDDYTCRCCGFRSEKYQEILFLNGNRQDTRLSNLSTICTFCHQCLNLDQAAQMRSGVLVWLPEIAQDDLHHIMRSIYIARISQGPIADAARNALNILMNRRDEARKRLGTDDVGILATVLRDYLTPRAYDLRVEKLDGIRLLPLDRRIIREGELEFNQFPQVLAWWRSKDGPSSPPDALFSNLMPENMKSGFPKGAHV